jgi:ABC-type nitrate/sulfonate/bicarbonate transport system substrate-binding protein
MTFYRRVAFLALALTLGAGTVPTTAADKIVVHRAFNSLTAVHWPDFVAESEGFNERAGLDVESVILPAEAMIAALIGGSVDIALPNVTSLALAADKGANIVAVGVGADNQPYHLMASPAIKTFANLKGKNLALADPTEIYTEVTRQILKKNGLNMATDVNVIFGNGQNQRFAAILNGAIQAGLFSLPSDAELLSRGYNSLAFTPDYVPNLTLSVNAVNRPWATEHADTLRRFLRARSEAIKWLNDPANENRAIAILMDATKSSKPAATAAYDYYIRKAKVFPNDGCVRRAGIETQLRMLKEAGRLSKLSASDAGKLMDRQWCPK